MHVNLLLNKGEGGKLQLFTCYQGDGRNCTHVRKIDGYAAWFLNLLVSKGEIVLSNEKTSTCNRNLRVIGCTDYVLLKNFSIGENRDMQKFTC